MKISLISPPLKKEDRYGKSLAKVGPVTEPLGLAYLAAAIKENRADDVEIIDTIALNYNLKDLQEHLQRIKSDVVGISILTPMYLVAKDTIKIVRETLKDAIIIVGGPHVTIFPKETLKENNDINYAVIGEGEETIIELLESIEKNKSKNKIKGIAYKKDNKIVINEPRGFIKDLDKTSLPARELLPMERYKPTATYYKKLPSYVMLTSRGCPFRCVYCSKISGNTYRHHSVERVIKEMEILINEYKTKEIIFRDDTFTISRPFIVDLCNEIIKRELNKKIKWTCMTRVNLVDQELLNLMKKAGCWSMHYGVESGSQRLLDLIQKDITIAQIKNALKWTKKAKINTVAFFMLGLPTETKEESLETIKFTKTCGADWIQVTITVPYPGTKLFEIAKKDGTLKSLKWEDYQTWAGWSNKELVYVPKGRDAEELKNLQKKAVRTFYLRPKFILKQIIKLRSIENIKTYSQGAYAIIKSKFKK